MQNKRLQSKVISTGLPVDSGDESPVTVKREGKPATERPAIQDPEVTLNPTSEDRGRRRRLQDPLPLEAPSEVTDGPSFTQQPAKDVELKSNSTSVEQPFVNPTYVPRSGYYFQHDDRSALTAGRNNKRRVYDRSGWDDHLAKVRLVDQYRDSGFGSQIRRKDERRFGGSQDITQGKDFKWHHDRFFETQEEEKDERRKPMSGEKRAITESGSLDGKAPEGIEHKLENKEKVSSDKMKKTEEQPIVAEKKVGRRFSELIPAKREREHHGERGEELDRGRWKETSQQSDRVSSQGRSGRFMRGRDRWGRRGDANDRNFRSNFVVVEKWKHDMFDQANRSPSPKDEEDHVAKIEALLAA